MVRLISTLLRLWHSRIRVFFSSRNHIQYQRIRGNLESICILQNRNGRHVTPCLPPTLLKKHTRRYRFCSFSEGYSSHVIVFAVVAIKGRDQPLRRAWCHEFPFTPRVRQAWALPVVLQERATFETKVRHLKENATDRFFRITSRWFFYRDQRLTWSWQQKLRDGIESNIKIYWLLRKQLFFW